MSKQCSRDHYRQLVTTGDCATRKDELYVFMLRHPNHTRKELEHALADPRRWPISSVAGRVKDLIDDGAVVESAKRRKCTITGKMVHTLEALKASEMHQPDMFKQLQQQEGVRS